MKNMIEIKGGRSINGNEVPSNWICDLVYFDGSLVSLFKDRLGSDFLVVWVDCDTRKNRWLVMPISRHFLRGYLNGDVTISEIFLGAINFYFFDTTLKNSRKNFKIIDLVDIPEEYVPSPQSYIIEELMTDDACRFRSRLSGDYYLGLDGSLEMDDFHIITKFYLQLYSFHYSIANLSNQMLGELLSSIINKKWRGGITSVNIFSGMKRLIPSIHRPGVSSIVYNSPGHIKLDMLPEIGLEIERSMNAIIGEDDFNNLQNIYSEVYKFFRQNGLSGIESDFISEGDRILDLAVEEEIVARIKIFIRAMNWMDYEKYFMGLNASPLQRLRFLLAYYRRLLKLRPLVLDNKLILGKSALDV